MDCKNCLLREQCLDPLKDRSLCKGFERCCCGDTQMEKEVCWNGIQMTCPTCHKELIDFDVREIGDWYWLSDDGHVHLDIEASMPFNMGNREVDDD